MLVHRGAGIASVLMRSEQGIVGPVPSTERLKCYLDLVVPVQDIENGTYELILRLGLVQCIECRQFMRQQKSELVPLWSALVVALWLLGQARGEIVVRE
mgnify:CR=1 FL=1